MARRVAYKTHKKTQSRRTRTRTRTRTRKPRQPRRTRRKRHVNTRTLTPHPRRAKRGRGRQFGGDAFASGGFGCVFRPALTCKGGASVPNQVISKLMPARYAQEEYDNIKTIESALNHIPNYGDYFLLAGIQMCEPAPLKTSDKKGINKCHSMERRDITESNINDHLSELRMLNIPDGGEPIDDFVRRYASDGATLIRLNATLIQLLVDGIIPMNKSGIHHADIKDSNVLATINGTSNQMYTRLIDWGVSFRYNSSEIADRFTDSSLQYNVPYSNILFNDTLEDDYFIWAQTPELNRESLEKFTATFVYKWVHKHPGHFSVIDSEMKSLIPPNLSDDIYTSLTYDARAFINKRKAGYMRVVHYLVAVLREFGTADGKLDLLQYYNKVFIHNLDVWGFFTIYMRIASTLVSHHRSKWAKFAIAVEHITMAHIFESPESVISVPDLVEKLKLLGPMIESATT